MVKVSGLGEVLMFSRGIKSDHKSCPPMTPHSTSMVELNHDCDYMWQQRWPIFIWGQDGRVVKVSGLGEVLMLSRGIKSDHKSCPPRRPHGTSMVESFRD